MFNPRLNSGDVGVGVNVRQLRNEFYTRFVTTYSLRPVDTGSVFKEYGAGWKVFIADEERDGRYRQIAESDKRIAGEDLEELIIRATQKPDSEGQDDDNPLSRAFRAMSGFTRFLSSLR